MKSFNIELDSLRVVSMNNTETYYPFSMIKEWLRNFQQEIVNAYNGNLDLAIEEMQEETVIEFLEYRES